MNLDTEDLLLLWATRQTGVLEALLDGAGTPEAVAEETGVTERAARITIEALADLGLFYEGEGPSDSSGESTYEPTNAALGLLTTRDVRSIGSLPHRLDCLENWLALPETMYGSRSPTDTADNPRHFAGAMATIDDATVRICVTEAIHARPRPDRVLDVGGGPGRFAVEFASRGSDVTLLDRPAMIDAVADHLEPTSVELVAGDALDELPTGFDLAFLGRLCHGFGPDENQALFENAFEALDAGGAVVAVDYVRGRSDRAASFAAHMLAQTTAGDVYGEDEFHDWLAKAGFEEADVRDVPGTTLQAVIGHKPA